MGHGKLKKFAENETFRCLLQPAAEEVMSHGPGGALLLRDHPVKGRWNTGMFASDQPIVLELGCGKGEYTIALAERHPEMNFIGVDIKGARLWKGAKYATEKPLTNVAFLRTRIEFIPAFFGPGEVSEIWLTFSDPQLKSPNSRLTSPLFLERYRSFLAPGGIVHLKTDSRFLHEYTKAVIAANALPVLASGTDIYREGVMCSGGKRVLPGSMATPGHEKGRGPSQVEGVVNGHSGKAPSSPEETPLQDLAAVFEVQTFYESMFLEMGLPITYLAFTLDRPASLSRPETLPVGALDPVSRAETLPVGALDPAPASRDSFEAQSGEGPFVAPALPSGNGPFVAPAVPSGDAPFAAPADFDEKFWREAEGPRRTFSHQPAKK